MRQPQRRGTLEQGRPFRAVQPEAGGQTLCPHNRPITVCWLPQEKGTAMDEVASLRVILTGEGSAES